MYCPSSEKLDPGFILYLSFQRSDVRGSDLLWRHTSTPNYYWGPCTTQLFINVQCSPGWHFLCGLFWQRHLSLFMQVNDFLSSNCANCVPQGVLVSPYLVLPPWVSLFSMISYVSFCLLSECRIRLFVLSPTLPVADQLVSKAPHWISNLMLATLFQFTDFPLASTTL